MIHWSGIFFSLIHSPFSNDSFRAGSDPLSRLYQAWASLSQSLSGIAFRQTAWGSGRARIYGPNRSSFSSPSGIYQFIIFPVFRTQYFHSYFPWFIRPAIVLRFRDHFVVGLAGQLFRGGSHDPSISLIVEALFRL